MKPPISPSRNAKGGKASKPEAYSAPSPKVSRQKKAKVLTTSERDAFLASRPDLKPKA